MTDMNYKNKLMGLSLILLAMFSACTDEVEKGGRDSDTGDHRITFAVGTAAARVPPNHTKPAPWRCRANWMGKPST